MAWDIPNIIINLRKEIEESSGDVTDLETRVGTLESTVSPLPGRITAVEGEVDALQADLDATPVTVTGTTIEIDGAAAIPAESLTMEVVPTQDLHGYSKPWAGGAGKNLLNSTIVWWCNNYSSFDGTDSDTLDTRARTTPAFAFPHVGIYTMSGFPDNVTGIVQVRCFDNEKNDLGTATLSGNTFTTLEGTAYIYILVGGTGLSHDIFDSAEMQIESGSSATTFEPYSNVCPITGKSSVKIETTDGDTTNDAEVSLGATVYAGEIDFNAGTGTSTMANIASYDGETINEPWLSSMDEYTEGGTPTTGAQVVYTLDTPTTLSFSSDKLTLLEGAQTVTGNGGGDITISYQKDNLIGDLKKWVLANT